MSKEEKARLIDGADFFGEKILNDFYYDTKDYLLTTKDKWLRFRNNRFELKLPMPGNSRHRLIDQYEELEDEISIRRALNLPSKGTLLEDFKLAGYDVFCQCKTIRQKYKKGDFAIDLNDCEFENFNYKLAEIELLVENQELISAATARILQFAKDCGLNITPIYGKVIVYLEKYKPEHYRALVESGVI